MTKLTFAGKSWLMVVIFCLVTSLLLQAQSTGKISVDLKIVPLTTVLAVIEKQSGISFIYNRQLIEKIQVASASYQQKNLTEVLNHLLPQYQLGFKREGSNIILFPHVKKEEKKPAVLPGKVTGRISDEENEQAVIGATIRIGNRATITETDGSFSMALPPGNYTAIVSSVGYGMKEVSDIEIKDNQAFELSLSLKREKGNLSAVVVKVSAKRESVASHFNRQKNNAAISDGISAEQISRTPDKNVGEVLKRISGLSTLENKYVVVRGLSERYNQAVLNGQVMPSTELNRKNFSFDLIPSNIVENITVIKTLTPDRSAEFGGGLVEVNTLDIPVRNFLNIGAGASMNTNTTNKNFRSLELGGNEYWGKVASHRNLVNKLDWSNTKDAIAAYDQAGKDTRLFSNNWGLYDMNAPASQNYQLSAGRVIRLSDKEQLGLVAALSYRNTFATQDIRMTRDGYEAATALGDERVSFSGKRYGFTTNLGGMFGLGYRNEKWRLAYQSMYLRIYDQQLILGTGFHSNAGHSLGYYDITTQTTLIQQQVKGELAIGKKGIKLKWLGAYTKLDRHKPDNHQFNATVIKSEYMETNDLNISAPASSGVNAGALRWWNRALEKNYTWDVSSSVPFKIQIGKFTSDNTFRAGYAGWNKDRLFYVLNTGSHHYNTQDYPAVADAFTPERKGEISISQFGDDFNKTASLHALYGMFDNKWGKKWRLVWGARAEYYNMNKVNVMLDSLLSALNAGRGISESINYSAITQQEPNWRFFPSANLTFSVTPKMNLRLAYAKSIIRPDLRENSYFQEYDFELGGTYRSNFVRSTLVTHLDLRYEYYPSPGEIISVSLFHKNFKYPMEIYKDDNRSFMLKNNASAKNLGLEIELRKTLAFTRLPVLKHITVYGNFTALKSRVTPIVVNRNTLGADRVVVVMDSIGSAENRPQSGASNYMMNAGIYYEAHPLSISLLYNYVTNRMFRPAVPHRESLFEQPLRSLDGQIAIAFLARKAVLKLNIANILNGYSIVYQNSYTDGDITNGKKEPATKELFYQKGKDLIDYESRPGRTYSATFTYNF